MLKINVDDKIVPAFKENYIPLCFAADNNYIPQTAVMIKSIALNSRNDKNYDIIILSTNIDETNEKNVIGLSKKKNFSIRIFDISVIANDIKFFTESIYTPTTYSKEAYFRLFIPYLMPNYERVIYLDGDMVTIKDISPLMDINLKNKLLAATRDFSGNAACYDIYSDRKKYRQSIGIKNIDNYFISSLVIFNVKKFNQEFSLEFIKNTISKFNWRQHDQDILNVLGANSTILIDPKWSYFEELDYAPIYLPQKFKKELFDAGKDPYIIHYAGTKKAWVDENSDLTKYFWANAKKTPYFDYFNAKISQNNVAYRYFIFKDIYKSKIDYYYKFNDIVLLSTPQLIGKMSDLKICVEFFKISNNRVFIDGFYESIDLLGKLKLLVIYNGNVVDSFSSDYYRTYGIKTKIKKIRSFNVNFEITKTPSKIEFMLTFDNIHFVKPSYVSVEQFAPINENKYSFYSSKNYIVSKPRGNYFLIEKHSRPKILKLNHKLCKDLRKRKNKYFSKIAKIRTLFYFTKPLFRKKNIWLLTDQLNFVDKKTIKLYEYLKSKKNIEPYFVVCENCKNLSELKSIGKVLFFQSKKHKFLFMHAKVVVSSTDNYRVFLPMYDRSNEIRDLVANKIFVYYQKNNEDLTYNIKTYYNTALFIIHDKKLTNELCKFNNGYTDENYLCLKSESNNEEKIYKKIMEKINE